MDMYSVLRSKPHNVRLLKRYIKFIESRRPQEGPLEKHHICPKASDLFPEYKSFKDHPWNRIDLTPREHYIAHLLLWKTYGGSQAYTMHIMRGKKRNVSWNIERRIVSNETKAKLSLSKKGKRQTSSHIQNRSILRINKPLPEATKLKISASKAGRPGHKHTQETKEKIRLGNLGKKKPARIHSEESKRKMSEARKLYYKLKRQNEDCI